MSHISFSNSRAFDASALCLSYFQSSHGYQPLYIDAFCYLSIYICINPSFFHAILFIHSFIACRYDSSFRIASMNSMGTYLKEAEVSRDSW